MACDECGRSILAGVKHETVTGELDDGPFISHTCMDCHNIAKAFQTEGRDYGALWPQLEEHGGENDIGAFEQFNTGCLARVETASAKAYLVERYNRWNGLSQSANAVQSQPVENSDKSANISEKESQ